MKNTKRSLFFSITALILCCALLAGTTMAWFTDSVTSGVNTITAGNLDIEVKYKKPDGSWATIEGTDPLFSSNLWEPGHTEYVTLQIENKGTLALKYKMIVSPISESGGINVSGASFKLSDYLVFKTIAHGTADPGYTSRDDVRAAAGTTMQLTQAQLTQPNNMEAGSGAQYVTLAVYMPEDVGNEANYKTGTDAPTIDLGIKVIATQFESEDDSFSDDYDEGADEDPEYTASGLPSYNYTAQVNQTGMLILNSADDSEHTTQGATANRGEGNAVTSYTINSNSNVPGTTIPDATLTIPKNALTWTTGEEGTVVAAVQFEVKQDTSYDPTASGITISDDEATKTLDISVTGLKENNDEVLITEVFYRKNLTGVKLYHNGTAMTEKASKAAVIGADEFYYDPASGMVTLGFTSCSPFTAVYKDIAVALSGEKTYASLQVAVDDVAKGSTITLLKDINLAETLSISKNLKIEMNGKSIVGDGVRAIHVKSGTVTLDGVGTVSSTVENVGSSVIRVGDNSATADATLDVKTGVTISTETAYGIVAFGEKKETVKVYGTVTSNAPENTDYDGCAISTLGNDTTAAKIYLYNGSSVSAANTNAVYMPSGSLWVYDGATVTGRTGIYVKSGTTTIKGGTITGNGPAVAYNYYGNGGISTGDALVVDSCGYPNGKPFVYVHGGTFSSTNAKAVASYNTEGNERRTGFVDGGTFSSDPGDCVAYGYKAVQEGNVWTVKQAGTAADPFHISSVADWVSFAARPSSDHTGKYYVVDCDLDFSGTTDVVCLPNFAGNIDFQGHELKGFTATNIGSCVAVFEEVGAKTAIKNVKFTTINYMDGGQIEALRLAYMLPYYQTGVNLLFENVSVYGDVTLANNNSGLIFNWAVGTKGSITFKNCKNYANMINTGYTAPFMGLTYGWGYVNNTITFDGCENYGTIISTNNEACMLISNPTKHSGDKMTLVVNNCKNYGKIVAGTGKAANLALNVGSAGENFYTADQIKAFETDGKIVNAGDGAYTNVSSVQLTTTSENAFDLSAAVSGLENVDHYVLSFQFQGTGGAANGGVTAYDFTFNSTDALLAENIYAYQWKNAVERDTVLIPESEITEHGLGDSKYYTAVVDGETVYVYNKPGYWMRPNQSPVVNLVAYDANGSILLVGYYTYSG